MMNPKFRLFLLDQYLKNEAVLHEFISRFLGFNISLSYKLQILSLELDQVSSYNYQVYALGAEDVWLQTRATIQ